MLILYHADYDGVCAGAIAYRKFSKEAVLFPINYHQAFPFDKISTGEAVWILDYSISAIDMKRLLKITSDIGWIDHHKSSIGLSEGCKGIRNIEKSGCELTWEFFYPGEVTSWAVRYIGDRDIWKWQYGDATRHFYNGLSMEQDSMNPMATIWDSLLYAGKEDKVLDILIQRGLIVEKYKNIFNHQLMDTWAYEVDFEGYKCLALNSSNTIDRLSNTLTEQGKIGILYTFNGNKYVVSLYTIDPEVDVEIIAKKYGGGGHKQAAGFVTDKLPFQIKEKEVLSDGETK